MPQHPPSPLSLALAYLRSSAGCSKTELAQALGISQSLLSAYERGAKPLTREKLNSLVEPLGHPPEAVDVMLAAHGLVYPEVREKAPSPLALSPEERRIVDRAAMAAGGAAGRTAAENVRAELIRRRKHQKTEAAKREAEALFQRLLPLTRKERKGLIEAFPDYWRWALAVRMCEASIESAARRSREALEFANLALSVAERFPGEESSRSRLQGYCWAHVGSVHRAAKNLTGAEEAFSLALRLWQAGADSTPEWLGDCGLSLDSSRCATTRRKGPTPPSVSRS